VIPPEPEQFELGAVFRVQTYTAGEESDVDVGSSYVVGSDPKIVLAAGDDPVDLTIRKLSPSRFA
jgi:hypothetical protein